MDILGDFPERQPNVGLLQLLQQCPSPTGVEGTWREEKMIFEFESIFTFMNIQFLFLSYKFIIGTFVFVCKVQY
jgi:hypothetical protein